MALNFTGFKQKLFSLMKVNETEDNAYSLTWAGTAASGWSYGWVQFDLASGPKIGKETFKKILENAVVNKLLTTEQKDAILEGSKQTGGTGLTPEQITLIDAALDSDYGRQEINNATSTHLDNLIAFADSWIAKPATKVPDSDKPFLQSDLGKLWLCDVKNQGFVPVTSKPGQFESFLQGQAYRGYTKQGALSFDDILQVYFRQRQAVNFKPWDPFRRLANIVAAAGGYAPTDLEEAKGVLRAYTYYYVRNENKLMQSQTYLDSVNAFRNKVNKSAEQMILDNWKSEWGPRPASVSDYDDMLMGDDKANFSDKGDYQLNGRDGDDIIFGEGGNDRIEGGDGKDILIGGGGDDKFWGGQGNDYLAGGADNDIYYIKTGDGTDTIEDKQGANKVFINGRLIGDFIKQSNGTYKTRDGLFTGAMQGTDFVVTEISTGTKVILNDNFQDGDFGIHLLDAPSDPTITNTINGDLTPHDFDPDAGGIQSQNDEWGNIITDPWNPSPNRKDTLYDTTGNDRIEAGGGEDYIEAKRGGDEWLSGGDGSDIINSWNTTGTDIIEGGTGSDVIYAGAGDDQVFGENSGEMETLIADGEVAPNIGTKGDLATGNDGNDLVYGSNAKDALFGGDGHDLLVGGGGDDAIMGDDDYSTATRDWSFTINPGTNVSFNNLTFKQGTFKGDDTIYAGTGNDFVYAGGGGDEVDAGAGDDTVIGEGGDDFIGGGEGNDILEGDASWVPVAEHGSDYIDGGAGNDKIWGEGGSDDLFGGSGNDELYGDNTNDTGAGDDYLDGEAGDDKLIGNGGSDTLFGGDGNDYLEGDNGAVGEDYIEAKHGGNKVVLIERRAA